MSTVVCIWIENQPNPARGGECDERKQHVRKVRDITVEQLSVDADEVKMDSAFIDDLGADSLDIVELIMAFEEEFGVEIPDEKAEKIRTVADAVKMLDEEKK